MASGGPPKTVQVIRRKAGEQLPAERNVVYSSGRKWGPLFSMIGMHNPSLGPSSILCTPKKKEEGPAATMGVDKEGFLPPPESDSSSGEGTDSNCHLGPDVVLLKHAVHLPRLDDYTHFTAGRSRTPIRSGSQPPTTNSTRGLSLGPLLSHRGRGVFS